MRYQSIDILRTYAIFMMVMVHFVENLSGAVLSATRTMATTGFGAPIFSFLVGVSYYLWWQGQERKGVRDEAISKVTVRRGLFLFVIGFAFNLFLWLPEDIFNWDVLTLLGSALVLLNFLRKIPNVVPIIMCCIVYVVSPLLREITEYPLHWLDSYYEADLTIQDVFIGYFVNGYFPIFPWIIFPVVGFVAAPYFFPPVQANITTPPYTFASMKPLLWLGLILIGMSVLQRVLPSPPPDSLASAYLQGWTMFPASEAYIAGVLGTTFVMLALGRHFVDQKQLFRKWPWLLSFCGTMSKYSFSMYILHHAIHLWPMWIWGWSVNAEDPTIFWRNAMPMWLSFSLVPPCITLCYMIFRIWDRMKWPSIESAMRWLCDESRPPPSTTTTSA